MPLTVRVRTDRFTLVMAVVLFSLGLGVFALPGLFNTPTYQSLVPFFRPFSSFTLAGGALLFLMARYGLPSVWQRALYAIPAGAFALLGLFYAATNNWPFTVASVALAAGVALVPWVPSPPPSEREYEADLLAITVGLLQIILGALMLLAPQTYQVPGFQGLLDHLGWLGGLGIVGGLALVRPVAGESQHRAAARWLLGGSFVLAFGWLLTATELAVGIIIMVLWATLPLVVYIRIMQPARLVRPVRGTALTRPEEAHGLELAYQEIHSWILVMIIVMTSGLPTREVIHSALAGHLFVLIAVISNLLLHWIMAPVLRPETRSVWHVIIHITAMGLLFVDDGIVTGPLLVSLFIQPLGLFVFKGRTGVRLAYAYAFAVYFAAGVFHWRQHDEPLIEVLVSTAVVGMLLFPIGELVIFTMVNRRKDARALLAAQEDLQRQVDQSAMMVRIASAIHASLDLEEILSTTTTELGKALKATHCFIVLGLDSSSVVYTWTAGESRRVPDPDHSVQDLVMRRVKTEQATAVSDVAGQADQLEPDELAVVAQAGLGAYVLAPLMSERRLVGAVGCTHGPGPRDWLPEEIAFVEAVGLQVGVALAHARAHSGLTYAAGHDSLTGLVNRRHFRNLLHTELEREDSDQSGALLFLDLDQFKYLNDTRGHQAGDEFLTSLGSLLQDLVPPGQILARIGGDEFAVLMPGADEAAALDLAERIRTAVGRYPFHSGDQVVQSTVSIGVSLYPAHGTQAEELLSRADIALYLAKETGRNRCQVYHLGESHQREMQLQLVWEQRIRTALEHNRICAYSQPIMDLATDTITGHELLVRLTDEHGQLQSPGAFLPVAERSGLIREIDRWMIRQAVQQIAGDVRAGRIRSTHVNLSSKTLMDPGLLPFVRAETEQAGITPELLVFEITETALISDLQRVKASIDGLRAMGCRFSLDDFGAGFSSFSHLVSLPLDSLKLDGYFIKDLKHSRRSQAFVRSIMELARTLDLEVTAEFVEDEETLQWLRMYGVDKAQGYFIGRPVPLAELQ